MVRNLSFCCPVRLCATARQLSLFLQTLSSVLKHRGTAVSANKVAERLTLHPQSLSCTEALSLLLCWASLSRDTALLSQIHGLSEKHKLKELVGESHRVSRFSFLVFFFSSFKNTLLLFQCCYTWNCVITQALQDFGMINSSICVVDLRKVAPPHP